MTDTERLERQLAFVREIDKVKTVRRQTITLVDRRQENDAEHSWHVAVMAMLLAEHAAEPNLDVGRAIRMLLVHDLVEIDAGDTFAYNEAGNADKLQREQRAAERIFNLLPPDQAAQVRQLWDEFEARQTAEAKYAAALDRLQPLMHNYFTQGHAWRRHGVTKSQVIARNRHIADSAPTLWAYAAALIDDAVAKGYLNA